MDKDITFSQNIENIYNLFEFEMKKILNFYDREKIIKDKEEILNKAIIENWNYKEINWYTFIKKIWWTTIDPIFSHNKFLIFDHEFYFVNKINYWSAIELLAILEKYIPQFLYNTIRENNSIIKKSNYSLKIWSPDILSMSADKDPQDVLLIMLSFDIVKDILNSKKDLFKKIGKVLGIKFADNERIFKDFVEIRNIISHLNWDWDAQFKWMFTELKFDRFVLYLKSENIINIINYLLATVKNLKDKIIEKYGQ